MRIRIGYEPLCSRHRPSVALPLWYQEISARLEATPADQLAITIITIEEQLRAWYTQVRRARDADRLARAYHGLFEVAETSKLIRVFQFLSHYGVHFCPIHY